MAQDSDKNKDADINPIDLSALKGFSFSPDWASETGRKRSEETLRKYEESDRGDRRGGRRERSGGGRGAPSRDRRDSRGGSAPRERSEGDRRDGRSDSAAGSPQRDGSPFSGRDRRYPREFVQQFQPTVQVMFVAQDKPFDMLVKAMKTTFKTYELFELCRIVLAKENRFTVMLSTLPNIGSGLFISVPDQIPFESEEEAFNHVIASHLERFFEVSEVEVDPPKGNFQFVNRCQVTGELIGPPNYHRYQDILRDHFNRNIQGMSYDRYLEKVESVREPEVIQAWVDKMKVSRQYKVIVAEGSGEEPRILHTLDEIRFFLLTNRKQQVVVQKEKWRIPGEKVELMPEGNLRRSIEVVLEDQRRFPLDTANHLRGRLRRCNLHFTKRGSKGITYVCAVKRKHRYSDTVFSTSLQSLISFVESHPEITQVKLMEEYFAEAGAEATDEARKQMLQDLRWLVSEGYVTEYADDRLFADKALPMTQAEDKQRQAGTPRKQDDGVSTDADNAEDEVVSTEEDASDVEPVTADVSVSSAASEAVESSESLVEAAEPSESVEKDPSAGAVAEVAGLDPDGSEAAIAGPESDAPSVSDPEKPVSEGTN